MLRTSWETEGDKEPNIMNATIGAPSSFLRTIALVELYNDKRKSAHQSVLSEQHIQIQVGSSEAELKKARNK